jgi:hypothetical protein
MSIDVARLSDQYEADGKLNPNWLKGLLGDTPHAVVYWRSQISRWNF